MDQLQKRLEFPGFVVRGRDIPVKIVLRKNLGDLIILDKGDLFGVKGAEEIGRLLMVSNSLPADGQNQLNK